MLATVVVAADGAVTGCVATVPGSELGGGGDDGGGGNDVGGGPVGGGLVGGGCVGGGCVGGGACATVEPPVVDTRRGYRQRSRRSMITATR